MEYEGDLNARTLRKKESLRDAILGLCEEYQKAFEKKMSLKKRSLRLAKHIMGRAVRDTESNAINSEQMSSDIDFLMSSADFDDHSSRSISPSATQLSNTHDSFSPPTQSARDAPLAASSLPPSISSCDPGDPDAAWMVTQIKYPQLSGTVRSAMIKDDVKKLADAESRNTFKRSSLPKYTSTSMTNHHALR